MEIFREKQISNETTVVVRNSEKENCPTAFKYGYNNYVLLLLLSIIIRQVGGKNRIINKYARYYCS